MLIRKGVTTMYRCRGVTRGDFHDRVRVRVRVRVKDRVRVRSIFRETSPVVGFEPWSAGFWLHAWLADKRMTPKSDVMFSHQHRKCPDYCLENVQVH